MSGLKIVGTFRWMDTSVDADSPDWGYRCGKDIYENPETGELIVQHFGRDVRDGYHPENVTVLGWKEPALHEGEEGYDWVQEVWPPGTWRLVPWGTSFGGRTGMDAERIDE